MVSYYILFKNHEQAVKLHGKMREAGIKTAITPTPRAVSVCCGVALMVQEKEIDRVRAFLEPQPEAYQSIERIEQEFNAHRDVYC